MSRLRAKTLSAVKMHDKNTINRSQILCDRSVNLQLKNTGTPDSRASRRTLPKLVAKNAANARRGLDEGRMASIHAD